ncbi:MAG: DUF3540 domain-containing protein [Myxococcota bacterium]
MSRSLSSPAELRHADGTSVRLEDDTLEVLDATGRCLIRIDERGLHLFAPHGDLNLHAPEGKVQIQSRDGIALDTAADLDAKVGRVTVETTEVSLRADRWLARCESMLHEVGRWELRAERIAERATDVYRRADELLQQNAGRMRILVEGRYRLWSRQATIESEDDVRVDGKQIYLG